jgi:serine protease Do
MRVLLLILILQFNLCFAQDATLNNPLKLKNHEPASFADVVEPLIATVVNIYTEQSATRSKRAVPHHFKEFKDLFEEFAMPFPFDDVYNNPKGISLGSGFIVEKDGYIVTNNHVVENADKINVKLYDGSEFEAVLVGSDKKTDVALLKIKAKHDLPVAVFGDDAKSRIGDWVITIGNPFGFSNTVTKGIISSKARNIDFDRYGIISNYIQTDAPINKGNSGGPMFNMQGQVIGVNTYIYSNSGSNIGLGFAIPAQIVEKVVQQLKTFGKVRRGLLNVEIQELTAEICEGLGLTEQKGVLVTGVHSGGVGAKAGLKAGDIIVGVNQQEISSTRQLQQIISSIDIDSNFKITIIYYEKY